MTFLRKRETPVQNIAYIGIMAAINVVFVLISSLLPILFILLVFILPLTSVIVTIYCKKIYFPIYFVTTLALCLAVTAGFSIFDTFIYVLPSLITGFLFGFLVEKKVPAIYVLVINSIVQFLLIYLTFLFIDQIIGTISFYESIYKMIGLENFQYKGFLTNIFTYIVAQMQITLTYILVKYEVSRIGIELNLEVKNRLFMYLIVFLAMTLAILSVFYFPEATIILTLIVIPIIVFEFIELLLKKSILIYVLSGVALLASTFIFAFLYQFIPKPNELVLIYVFFVSITIIDIFANYCFKTKAKNIQ